VIKRGTQTFSYLDARKRLTKEDQDFSMQLDEKGSIIHPESTKTGFLCFAIGLAINSAEFTARYAT